MASMPITTLGDGRLYMLSSRGLKSDRQLWQVTIVCATKDINGVANTNGIVIGDQKAPSLYMNPGESHTFLTRALGDVCWQDLSAVSVIAIFYELMATYILEAGQ